MSIKLLRTLLQRGLAIPAHPLALTSERRFDERRQRALTRYYCAAGAGGIAVGVHTTQFAIREPQVGLLAPVLQLARETVREAQPRDAATGSTSDATRATSMPPAARRPIVMIAGVCGPTTQACREATLARELGYDAGLVSLAALAGASDAELVAHCRAVADILPIMGFYLQPAVGGRRLGYGFWRDFLDIDGVVAIKVAPFNRYGTIDVVRALAASGRGGDVSLYSGNDDNIIGDLLTEFRVGAAGAPPLRFVGGLLGHWSVWTRRAVEQLDSIRAGRDEGRAPSMEMLALGTQITDANAAFFDATHDFAGCIAGLHEVLRRQGLLEGRWCLDPHEDLSPGQADEIDRVYRAYPHLADDDFVAEHRDAWLA
jgi:dihydrodipicolinate synthase/N-acetylneuraminate lyase